MAALWPALAVAQTLLDPGYPEQPTRQRDVVLRRIHRLLYPTLTAPALARFGGEFTMLVRASKDPEGKVVVPDGASDWTVFLEQRERHSPRRCPVRGVREEGGVLRIRVGAPVDLARDVYDLRVMGPGVDESQPNAVRIYGAAQPESFRFAMLADHQLWDPTGRLSGKEISAGIYPRPGGQKKKGQPNLEIARQGLAELALLDPEFVIYLGDLVFGVDYPREYEEGHDLLRQARLPLFGVPGNHDAYAVFVVRLKGGPLRLLSGVVSCRKHLTEGETTWGKAWLFITCLYGDVKDHLFADLHRDGLVYWQRQFGPPAYAFDHGQLHFVALNTYDGTPERRHAFSIFLDVFDLRLGVPAVDNYGGYLGDSQLRFLRQEAELAEKRGQTLVVIGHHDPRGNQQGRRYHANEPFPTDPLSTGGFEEWNYDGKLWDSDPRDRRSNETESRHSGTALLEILARHGGYYLCGHVHHDDHEVYEPGTRIQGIAVRRRLEIIRVTTASSGVTGNGYWGYRLIQVEGARLTAVDCSPEHGLQSVPAGNLWVEQASTEGGAVREVVLASGLPRPTRLVVSLDLPTREEGYRFRIRPDQTMGAQTLDLKGRPPALLQVSPGKETSTYWVEVHLPAATYPPGERGLVRHRMRALAARGNLAPEVVLEAGSLQATSSAGTELRQVTKGLSAVVGQTLLLSAERSRDREGDRIISYLWDLGEGRRVSGARVTHQFSGPGTRIIKLTLVDEAGARATASIRVSVQYPPPPGCQSGCCMPGALPAGAAAVALALAGVAAVLIRRRLYRRKRRRR